VITLYGIGSPNVLKVLIALEELDLAYRLETVDVFKGDQYTDAFGALTPNRKVPVIVDDEGPDGAPITLWESGAILIHLAERAGRLIPNEPRQRLITLQWLMFQMAGVGPMFGQLSHFRIYAPEPEHAYARARYATEVKRLYDVVESRLGESAFLGGVDYSIADVATWPWLRGAPARGVDLASLPATQRWVETIAERPAVQRACRAFEPLTGADVPRLMREEPDAIDRYVLRGRYSRPEL
jgi:GST-like protein